jgi:hypothetical protein
VRALAPQRMSASGDVRGASRNNRGQPGVDQRQEVYRSEDRKGDNRMKPILLITILIIAAPPLTFGQETSKKESRVSNKASTSQEPYNEIVRMDNRLFAAFNTQNPDELKNLFTDDLEFYQDNKGWLRIHKRSKTSKRCLNRILK